jgi:MFS family permease
MSSSLLPVFLIVLVDVFGMTLVIPLLAIYAESFGATPLEATLLVSVFAAFQLISGPILGQLSDQFGRKPLLIISQIGTFIGFVILARASALWMVYLSRIIDGATAGNLSLAQAHISDVTAPEDRARSFGLIGIAFGLGFFIGPSITGYLAARFDLNAPIYLAATMSAASIVCTALLLKSGRPTTRLSDRRETLRWRTYARYFARPALSALMLQFLFFMLAFSTFVSGFSLFAERRFTWGGHPFGPREIGYVFGYVGLLGIILQGGLIGLLVRRFGELALSVAGFASLAVGYTILGLVDGVGGLLAAATVLSFGNGVLRPSLTSLITKEAAPEEQGIVIGLTQSMTSLAAIAAPVAAGLFIEHGLLTSWALVAAVLSAIGLVLARK